MERQSSAGQQIVLYFEFDLDRLEEEEGFPPEIAEAELVADAQANLGELHRQLLRTAARSDFPVRIEAIELRRGSIVIEVLATAVGVAAALDLYGGARQGLNQLIRDLSGICERFLRRFTGPFRPRLRVASWSPCTIDWAPRSAGAQPDRSLLVRYLIASNALLLLVLVGVLVVLLVRTA